MPQALTAEGLRVCGITGILEYGRAVGGVSEELVLRMTETLEHRGPDGEGTYVSDDHRLGLGNRRLAILDIEGGSQPMFGQDGTCLVFNGEIYNYPALRKSLTAAGARFRTHCDTEVILHLYERYGERCVDHLTGMFAFALWDSKRDRLFFARDPIGEKPFYWADVGGVFVFGSEIKALLEHPLVPREVNETGLGPYLANLVTPGPETLYRGIFKLPAGYSGTCDRRGVQISQYWSTVSPREWAAASDEEATQHVRELLEESVRARLMSDVPVGVLLSGGLDSSTIVALLEGHSDLTSFTVGFPGYEGFDERAEARELAAAFGTTHHDLALTEQDALAMLPQLIHHQDEPMADPVCLPLFAVCRLAAETGIRVVLAGEGADELFWGYNGYKAAVERRRRYRVALALPRRARSFSPRLVSPRRRPHRREQLEGIAEGRLRPIHMPVGMTRYQREHALLSGSSEAGWSPSPRHKAERGLTTLAFDTQEYEFGVRLPELLLMRIDRFSMANGVEARVPFLDPALVNYVYRLPLSLKIRSGATKFILKRAVSDIVPGYVATRPKQGFAAPTSQWFAASHGALLKSLLGQDALRQYFDVDYLAGLLREGDSTTWESGQILWPILNFGLWHKYWIEGESLRLEAGSSKAHQARVSVTP